MASTGWRLIWKSERSSAEQAGVRDPNLCSGSALAESEPAHPDRTVTDAVSGHQTPLVAGDDFDTRAADALRTYLMSALRLSDYRDFRLVHDWLRLQHHPAPPCATAAAVTDQRPISFVQIAPL